MSKAIGLALELGSNRRLTHQKMCNCAPTRFGQMWGDVWSVKTSKDLLDSGRIFRFYAGKERYCGRLADYNGRSGGCRKLKPTKGSGEVEEENAQFVVSRRGF